MSCWTRSTLTPNALAYSSTEQNVWSYGSSHSAASLPTRADCAGRRNCNSIWTTCAGIVQTWIANPSKRGTSVAIFNGTRQARRPTSSQALAQRCRIVLSCAAGKPNKEVAGEVGVWPQTVGVWRRLFVERRLDGLVDEPRPGGPRTVTDEQVEAVVVATLERAPKDATHWSRASMAAETGLSKSTIGRIWKSFGLKPHQIDTF